MYENNYINFFCIRHLDIKSHKYKMKKRVFIRLQAYIKYLYLIGTTIFLDNFEII